MSLLDSLNPTTIQLTIAKWIAIIVALLATHVSVAWWAYNKADTSNKTENLTAIVQSLTDHAKDLAEQQASFNDSVITLNNRLSEHSQTVKIITNNVEKEIENPVYRNIIVPSSGMQFLSDSAILLNSKRIPSVTFSEVSGHSYSTKK